MASLLRMSCDCGFRRLVQTGGLMRSFEKEAWWPFYCGKCGLVQVNFQKELACPDCGTDDVVPYGKAPASIEQGCEFPFAQAWDYKACRTGHLCPKCGQYDLEFVRSPPDVLAD